MLAERDPQAQSGQLLVGLGGRFGADHRQRSRRRDHAHRRAGVQLRWDYRHPPMVPDPDAPGQRVSGSLRPRRPPSPGQTTWAAILLAAARTVGPSRLTSSLIAAGDHGIARLTAATTWPDRERIGAAIDRSALSSSSSLVAMLVQRTFSSSLIRDFLSVRVRGRRWTR